MLASIRNINNIYISTKSTNLIYAIQLFSMYYNLRIKLYGSCHKK